jgi:hypothetical protein
MSANEQALGGALQGRMTIVQPSKHDTIAASNRENRAAHRGPFDAA